MRDEKPEGQRDEMFRAVFDHSPIGNCLVSLEGCFLRVNSAFCRMLGYSENELLSMTFGEVTHPDDLSASNEWVRNLLSGKSTSIDLEKRYLNKTGNVVWGIVRAFLLRDAGGHPLFFSTSVQDITERKHVEAEREQFLKFFQTSADMMVIADPNGAFMKTNPACSETLGYSEMELAAKPFIEFVHPDDKQTTLDKMTRQLQKGFSLNFENRYICKDGSLRWLSWRAIFNRDEGITYATARDITEHKRAEEALQESEERFRILLDQSFDGIFIHENFMILDLNQRMADILGYSLSELLYTSITKHITPASQKLVQEYVQSLKGGYYEIELLRKDSRIVNIEAFGSPCKFHGRDARIVAIRDITEQKRLQEQLRQAQKMEAIGLLAGGVAHDFNNILSAIVGYAHLTLMKMKEDDPLRRNLEHILASSERAATLTRSLLAFSRKQIIVPKHVDVNDIVLGIKIILGRIIGEDIEFKVNTAINNLIVKADKGQIEQVLMNLATNSRDAMPDGGTLTIITEEIEIDEQFIHVHQYGEIGRYAVISVADTGVGMDKKTKENIFEPFFTTKEVGKGTGLGLAMVYGTVMQHDGFIDVYSESGQGTTFKVYLPLAGSGAQHKEKKEATSVSSGRETVLLVEDDKSVREATKALLEVFGYTVIEAIDGESAVKLFRGSKDLVQLVISDVIMPGQSGKEVYDELKKIKSDIRVLFISGYSADILTKKGIMREGVSFISKPISPDPFLKKVRELLDR
jgi:two-component system cell cycle sensor histidine kinase/response regulator CckA